MAEEFLATDDLLDALAEATFERPPALVCNAHITGLSVARALSARDVPVIAVDRASGEAGGEPTHDGVAPPSAAVDYAGAITYPLDDADEFREDAAAMADAAGTDLVAFACMDEWVHAFAETTPEGVVLPFADRERIESVLDKESLYARAEALDVPYPETYRLSETPAEDAAEALGFPLVIKPARKRAFEEAMGTNVIEVDDREEYRGVIEAAEDAGVRIMAQEKVRIATGEDCSLASYVPPTDDAPLTVVGNARVRHPVAFGTSCLVERTDRPEIEERALSILDAADYYGISESEFVYDADREEYVLLDINTRPWKWISLPVAAGANLPAAAYADAVDADVAVEASDGAGADGATRWVYLRDYLAVLSATPSFPDALSAGEWASLASGAFEGGESLTTGLYRPSDPAPVAQLFETEFSAREYYCSC